MNSMVDDILPDGWENTTIEATCEVLDRLRKPISQKDRKSGKYPYYGATKIVDYINDFIFDERLVLVGEDGAKWESGDKTGFIAEGKYWVNNHAHVLRVDKDILIDKWLVNFLYVSDLSDYITGTTVPKLNQAKLKSINFPLPPISEQKRIVAKIDTLFGKIDKAINLTEESLKQAKNLLPSILKEVFAKGKANGWEERKLGEVCDVRDGTHDSPKYIDKGYALVTSKNLKNGKLDFEKIKYISEDDYIKINKRSKVDINDILFAMIGTIGNPVLVENQPNYAIKNVALFKQKTNEVIMSFLKYVLVAPQVIETMISQAKGATQKFVGLTYLRAFMISFPTIEKQKELVLMLDKISNQSLKTQSKFAERLTYLKNLKSSILSKAFAGEL